MFDRFRTAYAPVLDKSSSRRAPWKLPELMDIQGYSEFAAEFAGASFRGGIYRFHDDETGPQAATLVREAFPDFASRVIPFAYGWLGDQYAIDVSRKSEGKPQVLLLEPGSGEALEIPASFVTFHDEELVNDPEAVLAADFFEAWSSANSERLPLQRSQCVGYKVPLFLGGKDEVENLEVTDLEVYWSFCGQLRAQAMNLPPGTPITGIADS